MFAGALDTIYSGGLKAGLQMEYVAVAEADERRRRCVGNSHLVPESQRYDSAARMAWDLNEPVDVLTATPSCKKLSTAQWTTSEERRQAVASGARPVAALDDSPRPKRARCLPRRCPT